MKKHIWLQLLVCVFFIVVLTAATRGQNSVKVGYIDYDGFIQPDTQGGFVGYGAEYLDTLAKQTNWRYLYLTDTWENCLKRLESGEIDLLCTAQYTPERAEIFDYSRQPAGIEYGILYVLPENENVFYNDYEAFNGMRIGLLKNSYQTEVFPKYASNHGFSYVACLYTTDEEMTMALRNGEVDAIAAGSLARKTDLKPVAKFSVDEFYFITRKNNAQIMEPLDAAMEAIKLEDPYFDARLYEKYYGDSIIASQPMFTREEGSYIRTIPALRVAYRSDWFPYEYTDSSGNPQGISIEMLKKISAISGIQLEYRAFPSAEIEEVFSEGQIDLIASRCSLQKFDSTNTISYIQVPIRAIGNVKSAEISKYTTLALDKNSEMFAGFLSHSLPLSSIQFYDDMESCLLAVAQGRADFTISGNFIINQIMQDNRYQNLIMLPLATDEIPLCLSVNPAASSQVRPLLDKSINFINPSDQRQALRQMDTVYAKSFSSTFWDKYSYLIVLSGVAILLFVCVGALALYYSERKKLRYNATHDELTGCLTAEHFKKEATAKIRRNGTSDYYIIKFDVLHLTYINQKYGLQAGDTLLQMLTNRIQAQLTDRELIGRIVDDNFAALVVSKNVSLFQEEMHYQMDKIKCHLKIDTPVIVKVGAYKVHDTSESVAAMMDKASIAHKKTKLNPKLDTLIYNETFYQQLLSESQIESEMVPALARGEFQIYLQPQIDLRTMRISSAEALIRWVHPDGTVVEPARFIPLFERNGFVEKIDFYVLERVSQWLCDRIARNMRVVPISVNQSRFLLSNPEYVHDVEQILQRYTIPRDFIALELTESMCLENANLLVVTMEKLRALQVELSIDDFGSGYSSLNLLSEIPANELKIDRGFLGGSTGSVPKRQIIAKVVELAQSLKIRVVCEGIETKEQENFLKSIGCDLGQGFLYSRPIPIEAFEKLLDSDWDFDRPIESDESPETVTQS